MQNTIGLAKVFLGPLGPLEQALYVRQLTLMKIQTVISSEVCSVDIT